MNMKKKIENTTRFRYGFCNTDIISGAVLSFVLILQQPLGDLHHVTRDLLTFVFFFHLKKKNVLDILFEASIAHCFSSANFFIFFFYTFLARDHLCVKSA